MSDLGAKVAGEREPQSHADARGLSGIAQALGLQPKGFASTRVLAIFAHFNDFLDYGESAGR